MTTQATATQLTVDGTQAAIYYAALETAVTMAERAKGTRVAERLKGALSLQISAYRSEMARLSAAFPQLQAP